jgi:hypothetical protein
MAVLVILLCDLQQAAYYSPLLHSMSLCMKVNQWFLLASGKRVFVYGFCSFSTEGYIIQKKACRESQNCCSDSELSDFACIHVIQFTPILMDDLSQEGNGIIFCEVPLSSIYNSVFEGYFQWKKEVNHFLA